MKRFMQTMLNRLAKVSTNSITKVRIPGVMPTKLGYSAPFDSKQSPFTLQWEGT
jgi:hypothetical protein